MKLRSKDILGLDHLEPDEITLILDMARDMKRIIQSNMKRVNYLQGRSVVTLFYENSTRTRVFGWPPSYKTHAVNVSVLPAALPKAH